VGGSSDNFQISLCVNKNFITLFLCFYLNFFFFLVISAITNIIFAFPQPARLVFPGVLVPRVGNHCSNTTVDLHRITTAAGGGGGGL
jgi:hypothetical protein